MCVWATWCLSLVFAYHLPTACLGRGSFKVSALQLRTSGCWGAPNWHSALVQHAARRWACIPQSTYSTRMRQSIALWSLAWISLKVVLSLVRQLSYLSESIQFNSNTTLQTPNCTVHTLLQCELRCNLSEPGCTGGFIPRAEIQLVALRPAR